MARWPARPRCRPFGFCSCGLLSGGEPAAQRGGLPFLLLGQLLESPFHQALRTQQKMGYVVFAGFMPLRRVPGLVFLVQSPDRTPDEIETAIEDFLRGFSRTLAAMPGDVFEQHRQSILMRINTPDQRLGERSARYWHEIDREAYAFDSRERLSRP
ncbi:MAG: hypothetical protein CM1200mP20_11330 [Pseudomonadota bacterium]|nr:MAG: hypothetical protein CM1200mP20_11330 [Pseudomonadota bacterium]